MSEPAIFKLAGILAGVLIFVLAYRLFTRGYEETKGMLYTDWGKGTIFLKKLVPGIVFALFGTFIICYSIFKGIGTVADIKNTADTLITMNVIKPQDIENIPKDSIDMVIDSIKKEFYHPDTMVSQSFPPIMDNKVPEEEKKVAEEKIIEVPEPPAKNSKFITYNLQRRLQPNPSLKDVFYIRNGVVAFNLVLGENGSILSNEINNGETNTADSTLISYANKLINKVKFAPAQKKDTGVIYFNFGISD